MNFKAWLLVLCLATSAQAGETFFARVSHVVDGDTLWVRPDGAGKALALRIEGIDASEICQPGGAAARDYLVQLALQRRVMVELTQYDQWGRALATLTLDGLDLGGRMVRDGQAWSSRWRHEPGRYAGEEASARQARRGLFAAAAPESPREFRQRHGSCQTP